jgi:hypothetical protein
MSKSTPVTIQANQVMMKIANGYLGFKFKKSELVSHLGLGANVLGINAKILWDTDNENLFLKFFRVVKNGTDISEVEIPGSQLTSNLILIEGNAIFNEVNIDGMLDVVNINNFIYYLGKTYFSKIDLATLFSFSSEIIFSGAYIIVGKSAYSSNVPPATEDPTFQQTVQITDSSLITDPLDIYFTLKVEGKPNSQFTTPIIQSTIIPNSKNKNISGSKNKITSITSTQSSTSSLQGDTIPLIVVGAPCPPLWRPEFGLHRFHQSTSIGGPGQK